MTSAAAAASAQQIAQPILPPLESRDLAGIADRLRQTLDNIGMKQSELAQLVGVTPPAVSFWLTPDISKRTIPSDENLLRISDITGADFLWLTGEKRSGENGEWPSGRGGIAVAVEADSFRRQFEKEALETRLAEHVHVGHVFPAASVTIAKSFLNLQSNSFAGDPYIFSYLSPRCAVEICLLPAFWSVENMLKVKNSIDILARLGEQDEEDGAFRYRLLALIPRSGSPRPELLLQSEKQLWRLLRREAELFDLLIGLYPTPKDLVQNLLTIERRV